MMKEYTVKYFIQNIEGLSGEHIIIKIEIDIITMRILI